MSEYPPFTLAFIGAPFVECPDEELLSTLDDAITTGKVNPAFESLLVNEIACAEDTPVSVLEDVVFVAHCIALGQVQPLWLSDLGPLDFGEYRPGWFLYELPVEVSRLMLQAHRGHAAAVGLRYGIIEGASLERLTLLSKYWREGAYAQLRLVASAFGATVPLSEVPQSDRLDLRALGESYRTALAVFDAMLAEKAAEERRPRPPWELMGALQDRIGPTSGRLLAAKPIATTRRK